MQSGVPHPSFILAQMHVLWYPCLSLSPQIFSVAILLYTPLVCNEPIAVPILAAYGGVITRCTIILVGFYTMVYPKLSKHKLVG